MFSLSEAIAQTHFSLIVTKIGLTYNLASTIDCYGILAKAHTLSNGFILLEGGISWDQPKLS